MFNRTILTFLLFAIIGCRTTPGPTPREQAEQNWRLVRSEVKFQLATQQLDQGRLDDAITNLQEAVTLSPETPAYHRMLATCHMELGNVSGAAKHLARAEGLGDTSSEFHYALGLLSERRDELTEATGHFRMAFDTDPSRMDYLTALVESLVTLGQIDDARALIDEHLNDFDRAPKLLVVRATIAELQNDSTQADRDYAEAYSRNQEADWIGERHSLLLIRMGQFARAMPILQSLVFGDDHAAVSNSSVSSFTANINGDRSTESRPSAMLVRALATCHNRTGTPETARTILHDHLDTYGTDARAWWLLAEACVRLADWHEAHRCVDRGRKLKPDRPEWDLLRAYLIAKQEGPERASKYIERLAKNFPDFEPAQFMLESFTDTSGGSPTP